MLCFCWFGKTGLGCVGGSQVKMGWFRFMYIGRFKSITGVGQVEPNLNIDGSA